MGREVGLFAAGGKGNTSRHTPDEIESHAAELDIPPSTLVYASKMSAKVDNSVVQDGYQLYHHAFFFDREGHWAVVQQGIAAQKPNEEDSTQDASHSLGNGPGGVAPR